MVFCRLDYLLFPEIECLRGRLYVPVICGRHETRGRDRNLVLDPNLGAILDDVHVQMKSN